MKRLFLILTLFLGFEGINTAMALTDLDNLDKELELVNPKGDVLLGICTKIVLYFDKGYTTEKRQAILTMFDEYRAMLKDQITFTQDRKYNWIDLRQQSAPEVKEWLQPLPSDWQWEFLYKGGNREYDASNVNFSVLGRADWGEKKGRLSRVLIHFPLTFFATYHESVQDVLVRWLGYLQPLHGYAGIGTCRHLEENLAYRAAEYSVAQKYPGLEITNEISEGLDLNIETIKGISWQTILSRELLNKVGGVQALSPIKGLSVWQAKDVYLIQASDYPMLSDLPESYYQLANLLKPLYSQELWYPQEVGAFEQDIPFNGLEYKKWRERFFREDE